MPLDRRHADAAADPLRLRGGLLARRQVHRLHPAPRRDRRSGSTTAAARTRASGSSTSRPTTSTEIPQPKDRCNDTDPIWVGNTVYFRSDRDGEYNVFAYDTGAEGGQAAHQVSPTSRSLDIATGGKQLIFEQAGYLHLLDARRDGRQRGSRSASPPTWREARPRFAKGAKYVRDAGISPTGARAVFEFRGEIVTVPAEKGDPRNLTNTAGVHDAARPGRRTASRSPTSPTPAASTACVRAAERQGRRRRPTSSTGPASTTADLVARLARRSPSSTTRSRSTGSTWPTAR